MVVPRALRANYDHQPGRIRFLINARAPMMLLQWKSRRWVEISDGFYSCRDHQKVKMTLTVRIQP
jgi:hypothetical protein